MDDEKTAKLVCFGAGGDTVEYGKCKWGTVTGTGYGTPENPHAASNCNIPDGTPAIDKRPAIETTEGFRWVFGGPMCDVDLLDGDVDPCPVPSSIFAEAVSDNQFGKLIDLQSASREKKEKRGPLDSVAISEYVEGWREHGARIGHYESGRIVWDV